MTTHKICANCDAKLGQPGEPFHTSKGLYCRKCINSTDQQCTCKGHKQWRRQTQTFRALQEAASGR